MKASLKHRLENWLRELTMDLAITGLNWVGKIYYDSPDITWTDHLRWTLESPFNRLFGWAYDGSDAEIRSVYDGEIPPAAMGQRQFAELAKYDWSQIQSHCCHCHWDGPLSTSLMGFVCPECEEAVWIEPFEACEPEPLLLMERSLCHA